MSPHICYAANSETNNYNWGTIIGSAITAGILGLAIAIEQQKKKNQGKNILFREINTSKINKIIKTTIAVVGFYLFYNFTILLLLPEQSKLLRNLLAIIITLLTIILHNKFFNRSKTSR